MPPQTVTYLDHSALLDDLRPPTPNGVNGTPGPVYGNDVDAVDIAVRVAMVNFFTSANILGGIREHTRTLRLYSRPVVALQRGPFLKSRPELSDFVVRLSESQVKEICLNALMSVFGYELLLIVAHSNKDCIKKMKK